MPMVQVLESTLELTWGEVIVNYGIGSHTPCLSSNTVSDFIGGGGLAYDVCKGVGPGMTLAWPGWKQSVIAVEVDTGRLETGRFKKCYANCVLLYFPSTEIKSAFNVY